MTFNHQQQKIDESLSQLSWGERLFRSFGPLAAGYILDFLDLVTWGAVGLYLGSILGGLMGWWLAVVYRLGVFAQCLLTVLTAFYCLLPGTELLPLATIIMALYRFSKKHE